MESLQAQITELIAAEPGISTKQIAQYFDDRPYSTISAACTVVYQGGGFRREKHKDNSYCYTPDPSEEPKQPKVRMKGRYVEQPEALAAHLEKALDKIATLEAWKEKALARYPDLAVSDLVRKARSIVAKRLKGEGKHDEADLVEIGARDCSLVIKATVDALEMGES